MDRNAFTIVIGRLSDATRTYSEIQSIFTDSCQALESTLITDLSEDMVNEGVRLIIETSRLELPINDVLKIWKIYLQFLKQHQHKVNTQFSEKIVTLLLHNISQGLELSFLDGLQQFTDCTALSRKVQLLLFFCQRLFTTVVYLSPNLCNDTIKQSYEQLLLCRGVCFLLGITFPDQKIITSKLSKFDTLFSNCLEFQPSQMHRIEELQRRQQLYHATVQHMCLTPGEGVQNRYILLGICSYSSCAIPMLLIKDEKAETGEGVGRSVVGSEPGCMTPVSLLVLLLKELIWSVESLNTFFCGEISDEIVQSVVVDSGRKVCHVLLYEAVTQADRGEILSHLIAQCLRPGGCGGMRAAVSMAWSRVLLVTVLSTSGHTLVAEEKALVEARKDEQVEDDNTGAARTQTQTQTQTQTPTPTPAHMLLPCVVLHSMVALVKRAEASCPPHTVARAIPPPPLGLLCRALLLVSVSVCLQHSPPTTAPPSSLNSNSNSSRSSSSQAENGRRGDCSQGGVTRCISQAASDLKDAIVAITHVDSSGDVAMAAEAVLQLALPFPDILSFTDSGDIIVHKKNSLESVILFLEGASRDGAHREHRGSSPHHTSSALLKSSMALLPENPPQRLRLSVCDVLNALKHHCPATSIMNENSSIPNPLLSTDHAVVQLAFSLLKKTTTLSRFISRSCSKLTADLTSRPSKKRSRSDQSNAGGVPVHVQDNVSSSPQVHRVLCLLRGQLRLLTSLQHTLPVVYGTSMISHVSLLVDGALDLAKHFASLVVDSSGTLTPLGVQEEQLLRHQLLLSSCEMISTVVLCNGLLSQETIFNKFRETFLLLFESLGTACSEARDETHSLSLALMWNTLLQTCIDFGERVRVYPQLRNKVPTLIPVKMLHMIQAKAGGSTARLQVAVAGGKGEGAPIAGNSNSNSNSRGGRWRVVSALTGLR